MIRALNEEIEKLKSVNFIEKSINPFAAPMVYIQKPDKSLRVTIDFRMINKNVINDAYPMHRVNEQLNSMQGCKVFTTMDLTKGYH